MFNVSPSIKMFIDPEVIIKSIKEDKVITLPVPMNDGTSMSRQFKQSYSTDTNNNIYIFKYGNVEIITYHTLDLYVNDRVHCQWCSTIHDTSKTSGIPIGYKIININTVSTLVVLTTGYHCSKRCMYSSLRKDYNNMCIYNAKRLFKVLYNDITPAPIRELHVNFNGPLSHKEFINETSDIETYHDIHVNKIFRKYV